MPGDSLDKTDAIKVYKEGRDGLLKLQWRETDLKKFRSECDESSVCRKHLQKHSLELWGLLDAVLNRWELFRRPGWDVVGEKKTVP